MGRTKRTESVHTDASNRVLKTRSLVLKPHRLPRGTMLIKIKKEEVIKNVYEIEADSEAEARSIFNASKTKARLEKTAISHATYAKVIKE